MTGRGVDVGCDDIGLDLVVIGGCPGRGVRYGIEHREDAEGHVAVATPGESPGEPYGSMGILAAVLADARRIALDVAWFERRVGVEGRREEQRNALVPLEELVFRRGERGRHLAGFPGSGQHRPGLRDRIDPARRAPGRAERRTVVEIGAAVPGAVPTVVGERTAQRRHVSTPAFGEIASSARLGERCERLERRMEEPAEPHALAASAGTDEVHAVVPVARAHERQAMDADRQISLDAQHAVVEQRSDASGLPRLVEGIVLVRRQRRPFDERHRLIEDRRIAGGGDIGRGNVGEPGGIVRDMSSYSLARRRQPPVLDVALLELARCRLEDVLPGHGRTRQEQGERILELVAEAVGATRLVEAGAGPDAAGDRLVKEPAVEHEVECRIGRLDLHGAEQRLPPAADVGEHRFRIGGAMVRDEVIRFLPRPRLSEEDDYAGALAGSQCHFHLQRAAGIQSGADAVGKRGAGDERGRRVEASEPPEELGAVGGPRSLPAAHVEEGDATAIVAIPGIAGEERAVRGEPGPDERQARRPRRTEHPFRIGGDGETPLAGADVAERQHRDFQGGVAGHELDEVALDAVGFVEEAGIAEAVAGHIGTAVGLMDVGGRPPQCAAVTVGDVDHLAGAVLDRVVRPWGQLVLPAVPRPRIPGAVGGDMEAGARIGDDVDPGRRRPEAVPKDHDVFAGGGVEAAIAVPEGEPAGIGRRPEQLRTRGGGRAGGDGAGRRQPLELLGQAAAAARQHGPGGAEERLACIVADQVAAEHEYLPGAAMPERLVARLARLGSGEQPLLQVLDVGARPFVEDDDVDREALQPIVFVGEDELPGEADIDRIVYADQYDRQVARDPLRPQRVLHGLGQLGGTEPRLGEQHRLGQ